MSADRKWLFDRPWTREFTRVRQEFISELMKEMRKRVELDSALDVGCGVGDFAKFLSGMGFRVTALDGREANAAEGKRRYPEIAFLAADAENLPLEKMGTFDLVLCFGLLYHLENPFRVVRNLHHLTEKVLLVETMCAPGSQPTMELLDEGVAEDQALNYVAFYPSESCFVKMLYRAGFLFVYLFEQLPSDELYDSTIWRKRLRTMIVASKVELNLPNLTLVPEPIRPVHGNMDPWATELWKLRVNLARIRSLIAKPLRFLKSSLSRKQRRSKA